MNPELLTFHAQIIRCKTPEDLFGKLSGDVTAQLTALKTLFRRFALIAHVDRYLRLDEKQIAHITFSRLNQLHRDATTKVNLRTYGTAAAVPHHSSTPASMRTKNGIYTITSGFAGGDVSLLYLGEHDGKSPVIVKISSNTNLNDLLSNEATALRRLNAVAANTVAYKQFIPNLLDSFTVRVAPDSALRTVNVFSKINGFHPLTEVVSQFPTGIDARHFVWIFTRLLSALSFAHSQGIVHGAVLPTHVLINPQTHGMLLVDWCFVAPLKHPIIAMSRGYSSYYAPEVSAKQPASAATDIYMAAMCMSYILGADYGLHFKATLHPKFKRLLETCLFKNPARRPTDAWELLEEVQAVAIEAFGPKKFVKLEMA